MPHHRYFLEGPFIQGAPLILEGSEFHHLVHVMRAQVNDTVELVNGNHQLAQAILITLQKDKAHLLISHLTEKFPPSYRLILAQALPKLTNLEWILEKGTEIGATHFWLYPGMLSEKTEVKPAQMDKLKSWVIGAMKQCGRLDLPEIILKPPLHQWTKPEGPLYFGDVASDAPWFSPSEQSLTFFIGPEKGWHPKEVETLKSWGASGVKLSENILRTETAALVALTLTQKRHTCF